VISYVPGLCGGLVILKDDGLPFVLSDQKTFYQRNKKNTILVEVHFQDSPFGVENALSLMKT